MLKFNSFSLVILCAFLLVTLNVQAEKPLCLFNLHGTEYGNTSFENEDYQDMELNDVHKWDFSANLSGPRWKMSDDVTLLPRIDLKQEHFKYYLDDKILQNHLPRHFRAAFFGFASNVKFDEKWGMETYVALGFENDYESSTTGDTKVKGSLMIDYNIDKDFQVSFGAAYDTYFGDEYVIPQLGMWLKPNDSFFVNAVLPRFAEVAWVPADRFHVGIEGKINGNHFNLSDDASKSFIANGYVKERYVLTGLFVDFRVVKNLFVRASGGFKYEHYLKYYDKDSLDLLFDADVEDTGYFELSLNWTVNGPFDYLE
jgi:hypothetical protein